MTILKLYNGVMSLTVDPSAVKRIHNLREERSNPDLMLRILVKGGGCAGFQYEMELSDKHKDGDQSFSACVLTDDISLPFLEKATVFYKETLSGSEFIIENQSTSSGCGCGKSFST